MLNGFMVWPPEWAKVEDFVRNIEKKIIAWINSESSETNNEPSFSILLKISPYENFCLGTKKISEKNEKNVLHDIGFYCYRHLNNIF